MKKVKSFIRKARRTGLFCPNPNFHLGLHVGCSFSGWVPLTDEQLETSGALVYVAMLVGPAGAGLLLTGLLMARKDFASCALAYSDGR